MQPLTAEHLRHEHDDHPLNVNEFLYRHPQAAVLHTTKGVVNVAAGSGKTPAERRARVDNPAAILAKVTGGAVAEGPCKCSGMRARCKRRIPTPPAAICNALMIRPVGPTLFA